MGQIINNALYLLIGMFIGLYLGWTFSTMRYTKQARDALRKLNERGWYTHKISLGIVLTLTAGAAIWTGIVNAQLQENQKCTERALTSLVGSLNERTSLSSKLSLADSEQNKAFSTFLTALLSVPQPSEDIRRNLFTDYVNKFNRYLELQDAQRKAQKENPFPKSVDYHDCLKGK